ncbi:hypothetical protein Fmac_019261 [Flemingia macrophylla]|uniref:Uncharacterized protein n=1 Tax=Flemingia macrophylla TaxID=520843 RepID=A0ABD1M796_9FABA
MQPVGRSMETLPSLLSSLRVYVDGVSQLTFKNSYIPMFPQHMNPYNKVMVVRNVLMNIRGGQVLRTTMGVSGRFWLHINWECTVLDHVDNGFRAFIANFNVCIFTLVHRCIHPIVATLSNAQILLKLVSSHPLHLYVVHFPSQEADLPNNIKSLSSIVDVDNLAFQAIAILQPPIKQYVEEHPLDCIVSDFLFSWVDE